MTRKEFMKRFVGVAIAIPAGVKAMNEALPTILQAHTVEEVHLPFDEETEYKQWVKDPETGYLVEVHERPPNNSNDYVIGDLWLCKNMTTLDTMQYVYDGSNWILT
jgi:hypothetical protein